MVEGSSARRAITWFTGELALRKAGTAIASSAFDLRLAGSPPGKTGQSAFLVFRDSAAEVAPTSSLTARANTTGSSARGALAALRGVSAGAYAESGAVPLAAIETGVVLATLTTTTPASSCVVLAAVQLCNQDTNTKETLAAGRQPRRAPGRTVRGWPA